MATDPRLAGLDPEFERKLRAFMSSLPMSIQRRVTLNSGYRSPERQAMLFDRAVQKYGSVSAARKWVAPPGHSQHNLGKAADLGIPNDLMNLIHTEAPKHGLVFPLSNENWHIEDANARGGTRGIGEGGTGVISGGSDANALVGNAGNDTFIQSLRANPMQSQAPNAREVPYTDVIGQAAKAFQLDPQILTNLIQTESGFRANAISPVGARGLTQLMPGTARALGADPNNPQSAIMGGAKYLRQMADRYNGDIRLALAAYNWGPGNVDKIGGDLSKAPASVQKYVNDISGGMSGGTPLPEPGSLSSIGGQVLAGGADVFTQIPSQILEPGVALGENVLHRAIEPATTAAIGVHLPTENMPDLTGALQGLEQTGRTASNIMAGVQEPIGRLERLAREVPKNTAVGWGLGGPWGALIGGGLSTIDALFGFGGTPEEVATAQQKSKENAQVYDEALKTSGLGSGGPTPEELYAADKRLGYDTDGNRLPPTQEAIKSAENTIFNLKNIGEGIGKVLMAPAAAATTLPDALDAIIPRVQTPKKAWENLGWMGGIMAASTAFFLAAPKVIKAIANTRPVRVEDLAGNVAPIVRKQATQSIVGARDVVAGSFVDATKAILDPMTRAFKKAGFSLDFLKQVQMGWEHRAGVIANINSFLTNGKMVTALGRMEVDPKYAISIFQRAARINKDVDIYANLLRLKDDFRTNKALQRVGVNTPQSVATDIARMERVNPQLTTIKKGIRANKEAWLDFRVNAGDITLAEKVTALRQRPHSFDPKTTGTKEIRQPGRPLPTDPRALDDAVGAITYGSRGAFDKATNRLTIDAGRTLSTATAKTPSMRLFQRMSKAQYQRWRDQFKKGENVPGVVERWENGKVEYYATDPTWALIMKHVPDAPGGVFPGILGWVKRWTETKGTGWLNPFYGEQAMKRGWQQQALTYGLQNDVSAGAAGAATGMKFRPAGIVGTAISTPRMIFPAIERAIGQNMHAWILAGGGGWLPDNVRRSLGDQLTSLFQRSNRYLIETHGGTSQGSVMSDAARINYREAHSFMPNTPPVLRSAFKGLLELMYATHGAPNVAYVMKRLGVLKKRGLDTEENIMKAVSAGANLTGNPRMMGMVLPGRPHRAGKVWLSKDGEAGGLERTIVGMANRGGEAGRGMVPWWNVQIQSMRNVYEAYVNNPVRFTVGLYTHVILPATAAYLWNYRLGNDPNGVPYVKHMMEGRSEQKSLTSTYIGMPGRPAVEGHEWANAQELGAIQEGWLIALDHALRGDDQHNPTEYDLNRMLMQYIGGVILPTAPIDAPDPGTSGLIQNIFGDKGFTEPGDVPNAMDRGLTFMVGPMMHALLRGYQAYHDQPDSYENDNWAKLSTGDKVLEQTKSTAGKLWKGAEEFGWNVLKTSPAISTILDIPPNQVRKISLGDQRKVKSEAIRELTKYWKEQGQYLIKDKQPMINTDPSSRAGRAAARRQGGRDYELLGRGGKAQMPGPDVTMPTSPLWQKMAARIQQDFTTDKGRRLSRVRDIKGYVQWMSMYNDLQAALTSIDGKVNFGNLPDWEVKIATDPNFKDVVSYMPEGDRRKPDRVRNFIVSRLNDMDTQMLEIIKEVEDNMTQDNNGVPVKIEEIDPWGRHSIPVPFVGQVKLPYAIFGTTGQ